ncbi:hypothetical protein AVEN_127628-1 [Araneus ventricosus]|uniref:Uncharacterized protein n=1 Tax=Araneus ventricosus TaxID=182803 RepID=A0A4Y2VJ78_ARAVE|nr:hypothetical protein AVEN_269043-1 [Araneus ventricosus]GBO25315.1 hypothetical protein AVEN_127628-1 [Araneus ventricosus]
MNLVKERNTSDKVSNTSLMEYNCSQQHSCINNVVRSTVDAMASRMQYQQQAFGVPKVSVHRTCSPKLCTLLRLLFTQLYYCYIVNLYSFTPVLHPITGVSSLF